MIGAGMGAQSELGSMHKGRHKGRHKDTKTKFDRDSNISGDTLFVGCYNYTRSVKGRYYNCLHNKNKLTLGYIINYYISLYTLSKE